MAKTNSKDFSLAFPNLEAIEQAKGLTPDEQLREKVKHLSMQMFGLAVDLANQQKRYDNFGEQLNAKNNELLHVRALLAQRNEYIRNYCVGLKALKKQVKELQSGVIDTHELLKEQKKPKRINDLTSEERQAIQADYYDKRIAALKSQVQYRNEVIAELKSRLLLYEDSSK